MKGLPDRKGAFLPLVAAAGALLVFLSIRSAVRTDGSLLLSILLLVAVAEGCIAAAAAGTLVNGRWIASMREALLSVSPLLPFSAVLLLLMIPFLDAYPWTASQGMWLRKDFFIGRNVVLLLLCYAAARWYAASPDREAGRTRAAWYILAFVASQTLTAFDLVMSLEYPWISTLFGGYFFIESVYGGFAVSTLLYLLIHGRPAIVPTAEEGTRSNLSDLCTLMFGFSLMWGGLFFAQFLTIWYGNIHEEVGFIAKRLASSPLRELSIASVVLFFAPFFVLMSTRAKSSPYAASAASVCILAGILVERYVFLAPVVRISPPVFALHFACLLLLFAALVYRRAGSR